MCSFTGDVVVVVSASLDVYLADWCKGLGLELICTQLEARSGVLTGRYRQGDCSGKEKSRRVKDKFDIEAYPVNHAYGDTKEDNEMLAIAHRKYSPAARNSGQAGRQRLPSRRAFAAVLIRASPHIFTVRNGVCP